jgi:hypothetical protein
LIYISRDGGPNAEFNIELVKEGENTYPVINGIVKRTFSIEQIYERYKELGEHIKNKTLPERDFNMFWSDERIEAEYTAGNISDTKYKTWKSKKTPIGDWNCNYCKYKTECWSLGNTVSMEEEDVINSALNG